jgi:hypothetical protein
LDEEELASIESNDCESDVLRPCQCKGSMSLVHRQCLTIWLKQSPNRCNLCATPYQYGWIDVLSFRDGLLGYVAQQRWLELTTPLNYAKHVAKHMIGGYYREGVFACEHYHCLFGRWPLTFALVLALVNVVRFGAQFASSSTATTIGQLDVSSLNSLTAIVVCCYA